LLAGIRPKLPMMVPLGKPSPLLVCSKTCDWAKERGLDKTQILVLQN